MPTYDYRCLADGRVYEVQHSMREQLQTWGELCQKLGIDSGELAADSPIERLANGGQVVKANSLKNNVPPCAVGAPCCAPMGGGCGVSACD